VSLADLFFPSPDLDALLDAVVYGLDHGSLILASLFDYLFHMTAGYLLLFLKPLILIMFMNAAVGWVLDVTLYEQ
jgi:hypothetical protein